MTPIAATVLGLLVAASAFLWVRRQQRSAAGAPAARRTLLVMGVVFILLGLVMLRLFPNTR